MITVVRFFFFLEELSHVYIMLCCIFVCPGDPLFASDNQAPVRY